VISEIVFAFLDPDYKHRAEHADVIKALADLQKKPVSTKN
jgi:hypothetical protein